MKRDSMFKLTSKKYAIASIALLTAAVITFAGLNLLSSDETATELGAPHFQMARRQPAIELKSLALQLMRKSGHFAQNPLAQQQKFPESG